MNTAQLPPRRSVSRRRVLLAFLGLGTSVLTGGVITWFRRRQPPPSPEGQIVEALRHKLSHLRPRTEDLQRFAREHLTYAATMHELGDQRERVVVARFLLATDYFRQSSGRPETVRYIAYPDPYALGCANPFASR